ncbi:MAG: glycosyltransferase family 2 protein, partial [Spirochaetales bacterium]|nr:glycosyltransferase family 2 protein [Spirochaetales bacterium]
MTKGFFLLFFISSLVYWVFGWFLIPKLRYCRRSTKGPKPSGKTVSLIIPARNEEARLTPLLDSLNAEGAFEKHEVILADDGSTDGTAALASSYGCRVLAVTDKPPVALGKSWACAAGAAGATGEYLVFLDADVVFLPGGLEAVLESYSGGLLSVQPYHRFKRFYESFSAYFNLMAVAGVNSFSLHSKELSSQGAFGPCMVCRKDDYL